MERNLEKKLPRRQLGNEGLDKIIKIIYLHLMRGTVREGIRGNRFYKSISFTLKIWRRFRLFGDNWNRCYCPSRIAFGDLVWHYLCYDPFFELEESIVKPFYWWCEYTYHELCAIYTSYNLVIVSQEVIRLRLLPFSLTKEAILGEFTERRALDER